MEKDLEAIVSVEKDAVIQVIERYEGQLRRVEEQLSEYLQSLEELMREKVEIDEALRMPRMHLNEIKQS